MLVVEPDRQPRASRGGDDVGRAIADFDVGEFDVRRLEPVIAFIERHRVDRRQYPDQLGDRIVGEMRIGDMSLRAAHVDPDIDRPAPPDLYRSEEHTSELQSLMRISYAVFFLQKKK